MKKIIFTALVPPPIGPYSQAVLVHGTLYVSGQIAADIAPNNDIQKETQKVMEHLGHILDAASMTFANVVKTTIFLNDMNDFMAVNEIYGNFFTENPPARETVQVAKLPKDVNVEISVVAIAE